MNLLPPVEYVAPANPADPTNQAADLANLTAVAQGRAFKMCADVKSDYLDTIFPNWNATYQAGRDPNYLAGLPVTPPLPPNGFMVSVDAGWGNFSYPQVGPPLCAMPAYTRIPVPQGSAPVGHVHVGVYEQGSPARQTRYLTWSRPGWWTAAADDTAADGAFSGLVTTDDGVTGYFVKDKGFMGNGYWILIAKV